MGRKGARRDLIWRLPFWLSLALLGPPALAGEGAADGNAEVVALSRARVGDAAILARVESQPCHYRVTTADLAALRKSGVSGPVIAAMIRKCSSGLSDNQVAGDRGGPERPGLYVVESWPGRARYSLIVPAVVAAGQSGGNGTLILPTGLRLTLPGSTATISAASQPAFWIVGKAPRMLGPDLGSGQIIPDEYEGVRLVRLDQKADRRQLQIGRVTNAIPLSGVKQNRVLALRAARNSPGTVVLTPEQELLPGQYALIVSDRANAFRLYDFAVE